MPKALFPGDPEFEAFYRVQRRHRRRRIVLGVIMVCGLPVLICLFIHAWGMLAVRVELAEWRKLGLPTSIEEIEEAYSPVNGENAAEGYARAINAFRKPPVGFTDVPASASWDGVDEAAWNRLFNRAPTGVHDTLTEDEMHVVERMVVHNAEMFDLLETAAQSNAPARYAGLLGQPNPHGYPGITYVNLRPFFLLTSLAARTAALRGRIDEAIAIEANVMRLVMSFQSQDDFFFENSYSLGTRSIVRTLEDLMNPPVELNKRQLAAMVAIVDAPETMHMDGKSIANHAVYQSEMYFTPTYLLNTPLLEERIGLGIESITGLIHFDRLQFLRYYRRAIGIVETDPLELQNPKTEALAREIYENHQWVLSKRLLGQIMTTNVWNVAHTRLARIALAVEMYRLRHGRLPEQLSELVPEFFAEVPADPFTGEAMFYRVKGDGFMVYSTDRDQIDNGGAGDRHNAVMGLEGTDLSFRVRWREE